MDIKYVLILLNVALMFIIMIILYAREKSKTKKLRAEFEGLKVSLEKTKEDSDIENKIRELKDKADSIINDTHETVSSDFNSLSNKKIIEFEEYANQLFEKINVNHKEVVFLYDMLNDKAESIKDLYNKVQEKEKSVAKLISKAENLITKDSSVDDIEVVEEEFKEVLEFCNKVSADEQLLNNHKVIDDNLPYNHSVSYDYNNQTNSDIVEEQHNIQSPIEQSSDYQVQNERIIKLYSMGYSTKDISKKLGIGTGEVALVNNLYKNRVIV
ncbi:MAG: hypothetical protein E7262_01120 [Lachnospiraceae bacterium]|nr:hypothetical protein [Lachnospiraceae bacterium]